MRWNGLVNLDWGSRAMVWIDITAMAWFGLGWLHLTSNGLIYLVWDEVA